MIETIKRITRHAESVRPGLPATFTTACQPGDGIWQGDLGLELVSEVPADYVRVERPKVADKQLVPGSTQGSRHCLDALVGVKMFRPPDYGPESLRGPCLVLAKERRVFHPTHGAVTLLAGTIVLCRYQREWSKEQAKAKRVAD